jgi:hypothetical protein
VLDVFRMRQYFNVVVRACDVVTAIRRDGALPRRGPGAVRIMKRVTTDALA